MTVGRQEFERTRRDLAEARRMLGQLSPRGYRAPPLLFPLIIRSGNLLQTVGATNFYGLKRPGASVTTVPTAVPSGVDGACPDGLTGAFLVDSAGNQTLVWAGVRLLPSTWVAGVLTAGTASLDDYAGTLTWQTPVIARSAARIAVSGSVGTHVMIYNPWTL